MEEKEYSFSFESEKGVLSNSNYVPSYIGSGVHAEVQDLEGCSIDTSKTIDGEEQTKGNKNKSNNILRVKATVYKPVEDTAKKQGLLILFIIVYFFLFLATCGMINFCAIVLALSYIMYHVCNGNSAHSNDTEIVFNTPNQILESPYGDIPYSQLRIEPNGGFTHAFIYIYAEGIPAMPLTNFQSMTCLPLREKDPKLEIIDEQNDIEALKKIFESIASLRGINAIDPGIWKVLEAQAERRRLRGHVVMTSAQERRVNALMATRIHNAQMNASYNDMYHDTEPV